MMIKQSFILLMTLLLLVSCSQSFSGDFSWPVEDFTYINQDSDQVSLNDLEGNYWLTNFIFTNCDTVCPPMTANMAKLQRQLMEKNIQAQFVSFSIDPEVDTPQSLKEFGNKFDADYSTWHFLTGYSQEQIEIFAKQSFKALVKKTEQSEQVIHGTKFYLVDPEGNVVKAYDGLSVPFDEILTDLKLATK
jgi:protein SCO1